MIQFNVSLLFTIINLIVFYLLLKKFLFKPVMGIMEKREKMIADGLKNASDSQEEAARLKAEYEKALEGAKAESIQIVEKAKKTAAGESERILWKQSPSTFGDPSSGSPMLEGHFFVHALHPLMQFSRSL